MLSDWSPAGATHNLMVYLLPTYLSIYPALYLVSYAGLTHFRKRSGLGLRDYYLITYLDVNVGRKILE